MLTEIVQDIARQRFPEAALEVNLIISLSLSILTVQLRDAPKKNNGIFWEFFPSVAPPPPSPLLGTPVSKKKCGLFCLLGHLEHFWSSQKCSLFGNYSDIYFWE